LTDRVEELLREKEIITKKYLKHLIPNMTYNREMLRIEGELMKIEKEKLKRRS
jgi:hypothetical protein